MGYEKYVDVILFDISLYFTDSYHVDDNEKQ